jgi:hypothetical protein
MRKSRLFIKWTTHRIQKTRENKGIVHGTHDTRYESWKRQTLQIYHDAFKKCLNEKRVLWQNNVEKSKSVASIEWCEWFAIAQENGKRIPILMYHQLVNRSDVLPNIRHSLGKLYLVKSKFLSHLRWNKNTLSFITATAIHLHATRDTPLLVPDQRQASSEHIAWSENICSSW